ncbi:MAG: AhpC/TSA family protein, partial [Candidatus Hydrothermarchaeaceae archaeon]
EELRPIYKQFGINLPEDNGDESYELPIPATYVIKDGIIVYSFVDADYTKRAEPAEVLKMLSSLK